MDLLLSGILDLLEPRDAAIWEQKNAFYGWVEELAYSAGSNPAAERHCGFDPHLVHQRVPVSLRNLTGGWNVESQESGFYIDGDP